MKLLFDQNLSPRYRDDLADLFSDSEHVSLVGLGNSPDREVWEYARSNDYCIVTKDSDFSDLVVLEGHPPKVILIRRGNCSAREVDQLLRERQVAIESFGEDEQLSVLTLF